MSRGIPGELVFLVGLLIFLERINREPPPAARRWDQRVRACFDDAITLLAFGWKSRERELALLERVRKASPRRYG